MNENQIELKIKKGSENIIYKDFQIFTGYTDKNGKKIYTGDTFIYSERDGTEHEGEVKFTISKGAWIYWHTWHPFRTDIDYWFKAEKKHITVLRTNNG